MQTNNDMNNTKHTPGPWTQYRDSRGNVRIQGNVDGGPVAFIEELNNTGGTEQDHANARLISAAPELLEVLQQFVERCGTHQFHPNGDTAIAARAAIAKATGTNI